MTIPSFSRIEIRHDDPADLREAANELRDLSVTLDGLAEKEDQDNRIMRLAAHDAIRQVSIKLRGTAK